MNVYSARWFDTFLAPLPLEQTSREIEFITRFVPQPDYQTIFDLCCGMGRHACELSQRGYCVTGLDVNEYALDHAQRADSRTRYIQGDVRALDKLRETFDAVLLLWQSFGYFDAATNETIVEQIASVLNPRGRFILDIFNRDFFATRQGERVLRSEPRRVLEQKYLRGNRLHVELDYGDACDTFDWQLFTPDEIARLVTRHGFQKIVRCANFSNRQAPGSDVPRMQFVFQKSQ